MQLGGVLLGAGMILELNEADYLYGEGRIRFTVETIVGTREDWGCQWVIMTGMEKKLIGAWRHRRIQVKVSALKDALAATAA